MDKKKSGVWGRSFVMEPKSLGQATAKGEVYFVQRAAFPNFAVFKALIFLQVNANEP